MEKYILGKLVENQNIDGIMEKDINSVLAFIMLFRNMVGIVLNMKY